jgi:hypothetical protein
MFISRQRLLCQVPPIGAAGNEKRYGSELSVVLVLLFRIVFPN